ncbi:MAG: peptide chain release factor N(5)-glutamine methyltransferase [Campylobacterota bacterium]|nr:peptide chain release factor N(5)-glutamine methyltransferase [Campylobacterota bacterium]
MADSEVVSQGLHVITTMLQGVVESPRREAELLMMAFLECDQLFLISHPNDEIKNFEKLIAWSERRKKNEPLEYITNRVSFYSEIFHIEAGALIPRPETELLIDEVLKCVDSDTKGCIVEVGVGSGVISIILAKHLKQARFIAVDISEDALHVTGKNLERFGLSDRIELRQSDLLDNVPEAIDLLVSNPPYIANEAPLEPNLSYEPQNALFGGYLGDELIKELCDLTCKREIGIFVCEMGYDQREKVSAYLKNRDSVSVEFYKDYANFDRGFTMKLGEKFEK